MTEPLMSNAASDPGRSEVRRNRQLAAYLGAAASAAAASDAAAAIVANTTPQPFGINESIDIDLNNDGQVDFQIDHDRFNLNGTNLDYLQLDKNDVNGASPGESVLPIDGFAVFPNIPRNDFNEDGTWNGQDLAVWQQNYSKAASQAPIGTSPDANNNGTIDGPDVLVWQAAINAPFDYNYDHGYVRTPDCSPFSATCHPAALTAGATIGPTQSFGFAESDNAEGSGDTARVNRLIDEDAGQIDAANGRGIFPAGDSPAFTGLNGEERFLGVRIDLNDAGFSGNGFSGANGPGDADDPTNYWYGWIGIQITNEEDATGVVTGYAYEDQMGVAILAGDTGSPAGAVPEPGSALLAVTGGAAMLAAMRSRDWRDRWLR